jgi:hypothetical protein
MESYSYWSKSKNSGKISLIFISQSTLMFLLFVIYLQLVLSRNGNGPELSTSSIPRLLRNLLLPLFYMLENQKYLAYTLIVIIIISILFYKAAKNNMAKIFSNVFTLPNNKFLILAFASYVPIAVWWVSPRHLYLPGILFAIWLSQIAFSLIQSKVLKLSLLKFFTLFLVFLSICVTSVLGVNKTSYNSEREKIYFSLIKSITEDELGKYCYGIDINSDVNNLFRHEIINHALAFYSGNNQFSRSKCSSNPVYKINHVKKCFVYTTTTQKQYGWKIIVGDSSEKEYPEKFEIYPLCKIDGSKL